MDRITNCVNCGSELGYEAKFCTKCGTPVPSCEENRCINPSCVRYTDGHLFKSDDMYCDKCGKPTSLGNKILKMI